MRSRSVWTAMLLVLAIAMVLLPAHALAAGGPTIAKAPTVTFGQQLFGNAATDDEGKTLSECVDGESWWTLPVHAGDKVKIDWEGGVDIAQPWSIGTTDFNIQHSQTLGQFKTGTNFKQESFVTSSVSGNIPLRFYSVTEEGFCVLETSGDVVKPGPYDFIATVQHALATALSPIPPTGIYPNSTLTGAASLVDGSPLPDGTIFTLVAKWNSSITKKPTSLAFSAPTVADGLTFPLALPAETEGKTVRLAISRGEDSTYQTVQSVPIKVPVARLPVVKPQKKKHHRRRHHHHRRHHRHRHHR
jgi:hypothetical protein